MEAMGTVSIGVPVFNGEKYIGQTLASIISQTYEDLEIIVSDNASTDHTREIVEEYVARDRRIRYIQQSSNIGAAGNFNNTFLISEGKYFKWAAHDDLLGTTFVETCVAALEREPDAILAQPLVQMIDADGQVSPLAAYDRYHLLKMHELHLGGLPRASDRFAALARQPRPCWAQFGLMRRDALARTSLIAPHLWSDVTLGAELALIGRFVIVPEPLFFNRDHPTRFTAATILDRAEAWRWWCMGEVPSLLDLCPNWQIQRNLLRAIRKHLHDPNERWRAYFALLRHVLTPYVSSRLLFEPLGAFDPRIHQAARRLHAAVRRVAPGRSGMTDQLSDMSQ